MHTRMEKYRLANFDARVNESFTLARYSRKTNVLKREQVRFLNLPSVLKEGLMQARNTHEMSYFNFYRYYYYYFS